MEQQTLFLQPQSTRRASFNEKQVAGKHKQTSKLPNNKYAKSENYKQTNMFITTGKHELQGTFEFFLRSGLVFFAFSALTLLVWHQ